MSNKDISNNSNHGLKCAVRHKMLVEMLQIPVFLCR